MQRRDDGGLGTHLIGDKIPVNHRLVQVSKLVGEGGFSYVYLVKDISDKEASTNSQTSQHDSTTNRSNGSSRTEKKEVMVLKVTSIHSRQQRDIAEKEAKLLSRLSHPSIIKMYDSSYRTAPVQQSRLVANIVGVNKDKGDGGAAGQPGKEGRPQHLILMEYCEGGHALDVCNKLSAAGQRFDLSALIIAFGQICNAVSYLHAQRPPIVHRDLKPVNFLVKNGAYKLCDFGSAVFGHVELKTPKSRAEAEEVIQKTTTQMFRAPEMVDLFMAKKLTQSTDVWALGCCLYSLAFLQNCFEEGSNLAILSRNYKIPEDNPYGEGLVELIDRMLTLDSKARSDMTEVILCLSAIYSGRPLPPRKKVPKTKKAEEQGTATVERLGHYRTDAQGIQRKKAEPKKPAEAKKLNPDSVAARRRRKTQAAESQTRSPGQDPALFDAFSNFASGNAPAVNEDIAFSTTSNPFAAVQGEEQKNGNVREAIFDIDDEEEEGGESFQAFGQGDWMNASGGSATMQTTFPSFSPAELDEAAAAAKHLDAADVDTQMEGMNLSGSGETNNNETSDHRRSRNRRSATGAKRRSSLKGAAAI
eukprot:CAMPEP_0116564732 /NCGR_PEP_ID=MMETSP0397-20121206/13491_1 /TAXON_ID=216820 /ORGANISM="Cyclophora tenuis, Strain ECT3854" /LENGTH=585 /DNA_ID=CAMNT_0004091397 /DNA_START=213 /DNA_END=1970 /DNA_ORIENTATION=-